jgi:hypothetical protein
VDALPVEGGTFDAHLRRETRIDLADAYQDRGRCIQIGSVTSIRGKFAAEFVDVDYKSGSQQLNFLASPQTFRSLEDALRWLYSMVDPKKLPPRFDRALLITSS